MRLRLALVAALSLLAACAGDRSASPSTPSPGHPVGGTVTADVTTSATGTLRSPGSGPLGLKWSWFQPGAWDLVQDARGGWTFQEVEWCDVEPSPGQWTWDELDEVVARAVELGHRPMLKLRTGQCWATLPPTDAAPDPTEARHKTTSTPPADLTAYLAFVDQVVRRYAAQGVHTWAIENEVDVPNHWAAPVASYGVLARAVAPVVRAADPQAHLLDAGLSSTGYGVAVADDLLTAGDPDAALAAYELHYGRRQAGDASRWPAVATADELAAVLATPAARRSVEALDLAATLLADGVVDAWQLHFYEPSGALPSVLDLLDRRLGGTDRVEAWEVGVAWPGDDWTEEAQATEVLRMVALLMARDVRPIVYLPVAWTPTDEAQVFRGLAHDDGTVLAAGRVWLELVDALTGLGTEPPTALGGRLAGVTWRTPDGERAVVWATGDPVDLPGHGVIDSDPRLVLGSPGQRLVDELRRLG